MWKLIWEGPTWTSEVCGHWYEWSVLSIVAAKELGIIDQEWSVWWYNPSVGSRVSMLKGDLCVLGEASPVGSKDPSTLIIGVGACPGVTGPPSSQRRVGCRLRVAFQWTPHEWNFSRKDWWPEALGGGELSSHLVPRSTLPDGATIYQCVLLIQRGGSSETYIHTEHIVMGQTH